MSMLVARICPAQWADDPENVSRPVSAEASARLRASLMRQGGFETRPYKSAGLCAVGSNDPSRNSDHKLSGLSEVLGNKHGRNKNS